MPVTSAPQTKDIVLQEFKALDETSGSFEGYLSVFGNIDSYKDIVEPGAFQKTIKDATSRGGKYLFPVLWQHDPKEPIGGFTNMKEDGRGLRVQGQIDLSTPRGQQAYSGLRMGYLDGLSIGYDTIKQRYSGEVRHLLELRMWEGSVVTFPANELTRVTNVKAACGSTDWPLGERNAPWDGARAHREILAWATSENGDLDTAKMKSVHFYVDDESDDRAGDYKMPFCFIRNGNPVAMPKGIMTCAAVLQGAMGGGEFGDADEAMKTRIASYYKKMANEFNDKTITAPWDNDSAEKDEKLSMQTKHDTSPRDFTSVLNDRQPDELTEELYDLFGALMTSVFEHLHMAGGDAKAGIEDSLKQFEQAILDWTDEAVKAGVGDEDGDDDDGIGEKSDHPTEQKSMTIAHFTFSTRAMKQALRAYVKEGRTLSSFSKNRITNALDSIAEAVQELQNMLEDKNPYNPADEDEDEKPDVPNSAALDDAPTKPNSHQKAEELPVEEEIPTEQTKEEEAPLIKEEEFEEEEKSKPEEDSTSMEDIRKLLSEMKTRIREHSEA